MNSRRGRRPARTRATARNFAPHQLIRSAFRREHGFVRKHTRFDPPQYKTTVQTNFKRRATITGTESYLTIPISQLVPTGIPEIKISLIQAWNTEDGTINLVYAEKSAGGSEEYVDEDRLETSDFGGKNHFAACSISPPQDDWLNIQTVASPDIRVKGVGKILIDISFQGRYPLPVVDLDLP